MAQGEGIVRINPALFAKLASPPSTALAEGIAGAGAAIGQGLAEGFRLRAARQEKAKEREHEKEIATAQIASRKNLQEAALGAKDALTRWVETERNKIRERHAAVAEGKLAEMLRSNAASEVRANTRLKQFDKEIELAVDAQDALNKYREFEAKHKLDILDAERANRKILADLEKEKITLSRERFELMSRQFVSEEMKTTQQRIKDLQSAAQRAAAKIGSSGQPIENIERQLNDLIEGNRETLSLILGPNVPEQAKEAVIRSFQANIIGTGAAQTKPIYNIYADIAGAGGVSPSDVEKLAAAMRAAFAGGIGVGAEEEPALSEEAQRAMELIGNLPTYDVLAERLLGTTGAATQPAPR